MNPDPEHERLLADVTLEGADFRESMLGQTLRAVRRRRQWRQARHVMALFAILGIAGFLVFKKTGRHPSPSLTQEVSHVYRLVQTEPLPAAALVNTRPFADSVIPTTPPPNIVQTTAASGNFRLLNDDELLVVVARPAVLVRIDAHSERLILVNAADETALQQP